MGGRTLLDRESPAKTIDVARVDRRVARIRAGLRRKILESGLSQNEVERRCGWSRGYLSQVLAGRINLTVKHVLSALAATGAQPAEFLAKQLTKSRSERLLDRIDEFLR